MIVHKTWIINSLVSCAIAVTCKMGDKLLQTMSAGQLSKAIVDNVTHALVGLLSGIIVVSSHQEKLHLAIGCMLISSLIDADHFIAARSLKLVVRNFHNNCAIIFTIFYFLGCNQLAITSVSSQQHDSRCSGGAFDLLSFHFERSKPSFVVDCHSRCFYDSSFARC